MLLGPLAADAAVVSLAHRVMKVMVVLGTRPEAIKLAPVVLALRRLPECRTKVVITAQHRELVDDVLSLFEIVPDGDLDVMTPGQSPTTVAARVLLRLEPVLADECPDWLVLQGDTTSVLAASIAAHYARVRVAHVEAGLRSFDREHPFPEEMNRVVVGCVSDMHFAPTPRARDNLLREGVQPDSVYVTGNPVIDALLLVADMPWYPIPGTELAGLPDDKRCVLVTAHRRESHGEPIRRICRALLALAGRDDVHVAYPVHPNPNISAPVHELLSGHPNISLLPPLGYHALVWLMRRSYLILTDSGGIQEEAPSLGKPVIVLRRTTERVEGVESGTAILAGTDTESIVNAAVRLLDDGTAYGVMSRAANPYGDGRAAERIVDALLGRTVGCGSCALSAATTVGGADERGA